ncbi:hypothetical protein N9A68_04470 [Cyclobacteriaceae bacterium]|nr:hypothetical protein [Cyclobacteriaceae bacterium]
MYGISHRRFTITEKWKSPLFRKLSPNVKCVYFYLWENCDGAGFYEIDTETISFYTQVPLAEIEPILESLKEQEITLSNGWLFILNYVEYQGNGNLNPNNNAHKAIIPKLHQNIIHFKECLRTQNNLAPYKELISSSSKSNSLCKSIDKSNSLGNNISNDESKDLKTKKTELPIKEKKVKIRYLNKGKCCDYCNARGYEICKLESCRASDKDVFKELIKTPLK